MQYQKKKHKPAKKNILPKTEKSIKGDFESRKISRVYGRPFWPLFLSFVPLKVGISSIEDVQGIYSK